MTMNPGIDREELRDELDRRKHIRFMRRCWYNPTTEFVEGFHTRAISDRLDRAIEDYKRGISTFIRVAVHQRAGKSELISVFLPPRFLAMFPEANVMSVSYNKGKAQEASGKAQRMVEMSKFPDLFPQYELGRAAVGNWNFRERDSGRTTLGSIYSAGLTAGLTGRGYALGILDDYCPNRKAAESPWQRGGMWDAFTNDFLTRRGPVSITVILATWWHEDDIHGRIGKRNNPDSPDYDPEFPHFEFLKFPARREVAPPAIQSHYPGRYLFLERYDESWYRTMYASLGGEGGYAASAMMDASPTPRGGSILAVDKVQVHESAEEFPDDLKWHRVWDYAHTAKQRASADPDFTGGTLLAFRKLGYNKDLKEYEWELYISDYTQFREKAPERDRRIRDIVHRDGNKVRVLVENSLDSKDGAEYLKQQLRGLRVVTTVNVKGDKVTRATPLEPIFDQGRVHIVRGDWNAVWREGVRNFDGTGTSHDEMIDNMSCAYKHLCESSGYSQLRDTFQ